MSIDAALAAPILDTLADALAEQSPPGETEGLDGARRRQTRL